MDMRNILRPWRRMGEMILINPHGTMREMVTWFDCHGYDVYIYIIDTIC
jgi:hypothetical protein